MDVDRKREIVRILQSRSTWVTAASLASELACSSRTVKSDITRLNAQHEGLIQAGPKGYCLANLDAVSHILSSGNNDVPQTAEDRKRYILFELLMRHRELSCAELAETLYISLATLDNELVAIKRELAAYGLSLRSRQGFIHVEGSAEGERKMVGQLIFDETKGYFSQLDLINRYFPSLDLKSLHADIDTSLKRHGFFVNDYALSNLIIHIAIFVERTLNGFDPVPMSVNRVTVPLDSANQELVQSLYEAVEEICTGIEHIYSVEVADADREAVMLMLSANLISSDSYTLSNPEHQRAFEVLEIIAERVSELFSLDFSNREFMLRFSLHLANLFSRTRLGVLLRNPQLTEIKNSQPFIYDVAVFTADIIRNETGLDINEDEIAYIALHVGCLIEEQRSSAHKLHAALICAQHGVYNAERIDTFANEINRTVIIETVAHSLESLGDLSRFDIVITSLPLVEYCSIPTVQISAFFTQRDAQVIEDRARAIRRTRKRTKLEQGMRAFFPQEFFSIEPDVSDWREVINLMGNRLIKEGYAFEDFCIRLLEREDMSSSAYSDIAMPHPVDMDAKRTAVSVALFPHGIDWQGTCVHAVIMLAIKRDDRAFFSELFNYIAGVLTIPGAIKSVARATDYQQFLETFLSYV